MGPRELVEHIVFVLKHCFARFVKVTIRQELGQSRRFLPLVRSQRILLVEVLEFVDRRLLFDGHIACLRFTRVLELRVSDFNAVLAEC